MQGLVIREPYCALILDGKKIWEMRRRDTPKRDMFAVIRKGSGLVFGVARIKETLAPLTTLEELEATEQYHQIPKPELALALKNGWTRPLVLTDVLELEHPVAYKHNCGATTWVNLAVDVIDAIKRQLQ